MSVERMIDGVAGTVMMDPFWQVQRTFVLAWLEVALEGSGSPGDGTGVLPDELVVQLWNRRKPTDQFDYVAEVILPAGESRRIVEQNRSVFGLTIPLCLQAGSQNAVVHNGGAIWPSSQPPTITVTPHGTWA